MTARDLPGEAGAFSDFFENAAIPMHWVDASGVILRANLAELELLGYPMQEYVGRSIANFHVDAPVIADILARLTRGETLREYPARLRCRDGKVKDVLITSNVHRSEDGMFINTRCITRDVTELRRAEAMRAQTSDYLEGLMEGFVAYDADWVMTYMNAAGERILGRQRAEVLGKTWHQAFPHAVGNPVDEMYQRVMRTRHPERMEYRYAHYGKWMEIAASPVKGGGVAVYFRDITDRRQAEQGLVEEARTLETLNRIGTTLAAELNLERVVQAVTDAATQVSGGQFGAFFYNVKNEAGESYMLYAVSGVAREAFAGFPQPRNTAVFAPTFSGEGVVRSDDITRDERYGKNAPHRGMPEGHLPVKSYLAVPVVSRSGEVLGGLFFGHERAGVFTQRAERLVAGIAAQAAIAIDNARLYKSARDSERLYRAIGESIDYGIWICDRQGRNLYASESFLRLVGLTQKECSEFGWGRVLHPDDAERTIAAWKQCVRTGGTWDIEHRFRGVDGEWHPVLARGVPVRDDAGEIACWAGINLDISRLKKVEGDLREADRRKDEFLATLAHELRNPLAPIRNGLYLLRMADADTTTAHQARAMMERQVVHLVRLVDDLLELSRITRGKVELRKETIDLAAVALSAVETSRPAIEAGRHQLDIRLPQEPLALDGDFVRLAQVVANLLNNAAKYTDPGGRISLSLRGEQGAAVVSVRDNGVGIPREMLPSIFDMFSQASRTLDRAQGGLGIGLALSRNLVRLHGGTLEAHSDGPGHGTEFIVRLPLPGARPASASPSSPRSRNRLRPAP